MDEFDKAQTAVLGGGRIEYGIEEAAAEIDDVIAALEAAKEDGMRFVVMSSGNYRGAQWQSVGTDWSYADED